MGTDSRATRSGQNSSGKRTTRSTAKTPANSIPLAATPTPRPGSAHKHIAPAAKKATPTSFRVGTGRRTIAKRKPPPPPPPPPSWSPSAQTEILDEIVVSTNGLAVLDVEMSGDEAEALGKAEVPSGSVLSKSSGSSKLDIHKSVDETVSTNSADSATKTSPSLPPKASQLTITEIHDSRSTPPISNSKDSSDVNTISPIKQQMTPASQREPDSLEMPSKIGSHTLSGGTSNKAQHVNDIKAKLSSQAEAVMPISEEKVSAEPTLGNAIPTGAKSLSSDTTVTKTEAEGEQRDTQSNKCRESPSIEQHLRGSVSQDTATAGLPAHQSQGIESNPAAAKEEFFDGTESQPDVDDQSTQTEEAVLKPVDLESHKAEVDPVVQVIVEPKKAVECSVSDEPSAFDDAMQASFHSNEQAMSPNLDLNPERIHIERIHTLPSFKQTTDKDTVKDATASLTLSDPVEAEVDEKLDLSHSVFPRQTPHPDDLLPIQDSATREIPRRDNASSSPSQISDAMDLDDLESSDNEALDSSFRFQSDVDPSSEQLESLHHRGTAQVVQKAEESASDEKLPLTDIPMVNAQTRVDMVAAATTAPSALGAAHGQSDTADFRETMLDINKYAREPIHLGIGQSTLKQILEKSRASQASGSSLSAMTDMSGLSSKPPSISSKATTPFDADSPRDVLNQFASGSLFQPRSITSRIQFDVRPRVSIPTDLTPQEYAMECIEAGENSRLNAYALHQEEYQMLRAHISHAQVSTYLNIRNGILRLWVRNPQMAVTREEAIGCAKDTRWFDVANVCFDWLVRRGLINYGCVEIRQPKAHVNHIQPRKRKTVVVIGAGFSGLGCARQLEGLFLQYSKRFRDMGEETPRVVVIEGRNRVGGRVYSRAFETMPTTAPGVMRGRRFTAEMGGMIITGFERGNPLNILVRGQLGLPYHCLLADMSLHDSNGTNVDLQRDTLVEQLYNVCLERVSEYKFKSKPSKLIEGNRDLMDEGRDSTAEGHKTIALIEETTAAQPHALPVSEQNVAPPIDLVPVSTNRMTGKVHVEPGTPGSTKAAVQAKQIGWKIKAGVSDAKDIDLDPAVNDPNSTLGSVLDNALMQHKDILDLNAQDFRLFNWHIANLEYSNATNLNRLSSRGWDVDVGNEWDGRHTMVVGGYQSVARGLATLPAPLDIRHKAAVKRITYSPEGSSGPARITLEDGKSIEADYVVNTIPLGVLKHGSVDFQPPLPSWKTQAIARLGFGVLNKVILVYKEAFWDKDRDIFGMLQTPTNRSSLNQKDYASRRGRFFQWFSVTNTTGMPCLLALMAGDAAYDTEITPNDELVAEATEVLRMRYGARVTQPLEAIVTRWESDRFARGSYSNAGVNMQPEDYQLMARTVGNLYFAGEHTIVTHPATVHGAYLSGLRAASDVLDSMLGPIEVPTPLVLPRETAASLKRKAQEEHKDPTLARLEAYEMEITEHILSTIGQYPLKPAKVAGNPYILYNKAHYEEGRSKCEEGRRAGKGKPSPNEVRTMTSKMWKEATPEVRRPFEDAADEQKRGFALALKAWGEAATKWERDAAELRDKFVKEHPSVPGPEELAGDTWGGARRAKRVVESYREADSDVDMD